MSPSLCLFHSIVNSFNSMICLSYRNEIRFSFRIWIEFSAVRKLKIEDIPSMLPTFEIQIRCLPTLYKYIDKYACLYEMSHFLCIFCDVVTYTDRKAEWNQNN